MIKQKSQILSAWFLVWDLGMTALAWVGAYCMPLRVGPVAARRGRAAVRGLLAELADGARAQRRRLSAHRAVPRWPLPPAARGAVQHPARHLPDGAVRRRGQLRLAAHLRIPHRVPPLLPADGSADTGGPAGKLGGGPLAAQPRLQPDAGDHRRHRPGRPQDRPLAAADAAGSASRTSATSRTSRRAGAATSTSSAPSPTCRSSSRSISVSHVFICLPMTPLSRRPPCVRHAVADIRRGAPDRRRARACRPDADDDQLRRHADDRPARKPALRAEHRRQAGDGHRAVVDRADRFSRR